MMLTKKYSTLIFSAALLFAAVGCATDSEEVLPSAPKSQHTRTLQARNIDTKGINVTTVKAHLTNTYNHAVLTEAHFEDGRFTIILNSEDMDAFVGNASKFFGNNIEVSAPHATFSGIEFRAYDGNTYVGTFNCSRNGNPFFFSYSEENLVVAGSWDYQDFSWQYDLKHSAGFGFYKKQTKDGKQTFFSSESSSDNLVWNLNDDNSYEIIVQ